MKKDIEIPIAQDIYIAAVHEWDRKTSTMRHNLGDMPARHFRRIEMLQEEILAFNNEFFVTFFAGNKLYEKRFVFGRNSICTANCTALPLMDQEGVMAD